MSELLLFLGLAALVAAAWMVSMVLGLAVGGAALLALAAVLEFGLADGKGFKWRS